MAAEKITDLIDDKAFEQLDRLLGSLKIAQSEFTGVANEVISLNTELGKVKGLKDLDTQVKKLAESSKKLSEAKNTVVVANQKAAKAEDDVVKATKERIRVSSEELASINKAGVSLDQYIRLQVRLKAESSQLTKDQRELNKAFDKGAISADQLSDNLTDIAKRQTELKTASTQVNAVVKAYNRETEAAEGSSEQLSARLVRLRREWDNLSAAQRENSEVGQNLFNEIDQLDTKVKELDGSTGRHQRNVGNYQSALAGLPGPIGAAASSIQTFSQATNDMTENMANSGGGISSLVNGLKSATKAALAFIATPLGATLAAISATVLAAKGWFEYNKNIAQATKLTKQLTGFAGNELKAFRAEVQATADTFGQDFKETIIATNAVAKQFGITQQEALDIVNKGFISGANASGEFLEQLREYPTQLRAVGLSASEMTAIISQNVKEGIYSDKGIDAIKEAGIRIRELTPATRTAMEGIGLSSTEIQRGLESGALSMFDVIQKVSNKLGELPENSAAVGTAIADIFGGPGEDAGLEYLKTLGNINLNLDEVVAGTGELGKAQQDQLQATEDLNKAWATLFDSTGGTFELLIANAKLFGTKILIGLINGVIDFANAIIDTYNASVLLRGGFNLIAANVKSAIDLIVVSFKTLFGSVKTLGQLIGAVLTGNLSDIPSIIKAQQEKNRNNFIDAGKSIAENYVKGFNDTVNGAKIAKIEKGLGSTDTFSPVSQTGGGAFEEAAAGGSGVTFKRLEAEAVGVKKLIDLNKKLEIDTKDSEARLTSFIEEQARLQAEAKIAHANRAFEEEKKIEEAKKELFAELTGLAVSLVNSRFEQENIELQKQAEQIDINKAKEIERINESLGSEEEKANKIAILEAQAQARQEAIERRQNEVKRRQAEFEKAVSIVEIIGNTASAITAALPNIPLSLIIGAIGAAQIAKVATTPIPQFATGTEDSPEGFAIVGERGPELRTNPSGQMSLTPGKPTLTYLEKGTSILPANKTRDFIRTTSEDNTKDQAAINFNIDKLDKSYQKGVKDLKKAFTEKPQSNTIITKSGIDYMYKRGNSRQQYLNRNL